MNEFDNIDQLFAELKSTTVITEKVKESEYANLYDIAVDYYGEKYVEYINKKCIVIHFPVITITSNGNDRGTHTIYDLYVRLDFTSGTIKGLRTSYINQEILNFPHIAYMHSHLSSCGAVDIDGGMKFQCNFCLGSSELLNAFSYIKNEYYKNPEDKIDDNLYYYLFSNLDTYLTIENHKDGGSPYKRASLIKTYSKNEAVVAQHTTIEKVAHYFIDNSLYHIVGNNIEFADTYENWKMFLIDNERMRLNIGADMGEYDISKGYGLSKSSALAIININPTFKNNCFIFKGKPVEFKIIDDTTLENEINELYPKKIFIDSVKYKFNLFCANTSNSWVKNNSEDTRNNYKDAYRFIREALDAT